MFTWQKIFTKLQTQLFFRSGAQYILKLLMMCSLLGVSSYVWADGTDLLSGDLQDATATLGGTGKYVLYLVEGLSSVYVYHKTKNVFVLTSIILIAIFINVLLKKVTTV